MSLLQLLGLEVAGAGGGTPGLEDDAAHDASGARGGRALIPGAKRRREGSLTRGSVGRWIRRRGEVVEAYRTLGGVECVGRDGHDAEAADFSPLSIPPALLMHGERAEGGAAGPELSAYGVPPAVVAAYAAARVHTLHAWQAECLAIDACAPLLGGNLVYCAPTSGGKTLVAELLMLRTLLLRRRKVLFIVPFVSLCVEKAGHLQRVWRALGLRIQGFYNNRGGASLHNVDVAVCTIERACGLLNRLLMEGRLDDVGMVVIDEAHMVSDATRGYKLELTIMKLLLTGMPERVRATIRATTAQIREFVATQRAGGAAATGAAAAGAAATGIPALLPRHLLEHNIDKLANAPFTQLVMMSATMSNVADLARWVCGSLYICHTRPVQLFETIVVDGVQYNKHLQPLRVFQHPTRMPEHPHIDEMYVRVARVVATPAAVSASDFDVARAARPGELSIAQLAPDRAALAFSRFSAPPAFTASAHVLLPWLCMETASTGRNVLVFAASRRSAERLAQNIAASMAAVTTQPAIDMCLSLRLRLARSRAARLELKDKLRYSPSGADPALSALLLQGVAYHHGGLTVEEREIVEQGFRDSSLCVLVATTTLAAGVNLPARRVIFSDLIDYGGDSSHALSEAHYRQMAGRAGRAGLDDVGEVIIMCSNTFMHPSGELPTALSLRARAVDAQPTSSPFLLPLFTFPRHPAPGAHGEVGVLGMREDDELPPPPPPCRVLDPVFLTHDGVWMSDSEVALPGLRVARAWLSGAPSITTGAERSGFSPPLEWTFAHNGRPLPSDVDLTSDAACAALASRAPRMPAKGARIERLQRGLRSRWNDIELAVKLMWCESETIISALAPTNALMPAPVVTISHGVAGAGSAAGLPTPSPVRASTSCSPLRRAILELVCCGVIQHYDPHDCDVMLRATLLHASATTRGEAALAAVRALVQQAVNFLLDHQFLQFSRGGADDAAEGLGVGAAGAPAAAPPPAAPAVPGGGASIQRTSSLPRGSSLQRTPSGSLTQAGRTPAASSSSTAEPAGVGAGAHATRITATRLGVAAFLSVLPPEHCLNTLHELDAALTEGLRLDTDDLHITYLLTPLSCVTMYDMSDNTWRSFASTLETLTPAEAALASRYNVSGSFVRDILTFGGSETSASMGPASYNARLDAHLRFFCAILLRELMSEVSILEVEIWSGLPRGRLQSLQLYTASHANSVVTLCRHLNWHEAALVFSDFVRRLEFGVRPELVPLLDVPHMTVPRARLLFNHKISSLEELVATPPDRVADILMKYVPFTKSADSSKSVTSSSAGALMSALTHLEQAQARQEQLGGNSTRMQTLFNMHLAVARDLIAGATELLNARVARTAA